MMQLCRCYFEDREWSFFLEFYPELQGQKADTTKSLVVHNANAEFKLDFPLLVMNFRNPVKVAYRRGSYEVPTNSLCYRNPSI